MIEINGDIIEYIKNGNVDIIIQGCNCFNRMSSGLAKQVAEEIPEAVYVDNKTKKGDIGKLGNFTAAPVLNNEGLEMGHIFNCYTQYMYGADKVRIDYDALTLCLRKINHMYPKKRIAVPKIGAGLAGGNWKKIKNIIESELSDMEITIVHYAPNISMNNLIDSIDFEAEKRKTQDKIEKEEKEYNKELESNDVIDHDLTEVGCVNTTNKQFCFIDGYTDYDDETWMYSYTSHHNE